MPPVLSVAEAFLTASPYVVGAIWLWMLPEWTRKWIAVAREWRDFRNGR